MLCCSRLHSEAYQVIEKHYGDDRKGDDPRVLLALILKSLSFGLGLLILMDLTVAASSNCVISAWRTVLVGACTRSHC